MFLLPSDLGHESNGFLVEPLGDDLVQPYKGSAADKEYVRGVDLDKLLLRMLPSTLRRDGCHGPFYHLEQGLLHTFPGDIPGYRRIIAS
jgi:hypothetical protein